MSQESKDMIPKYFTKDYFKEVLEYGLRNTNLNIETFEIEKLSLGGENYCSNIYRAKLKYVFGENEENLEKCLIIKSMPKDKQAALTALQIYLKETVFYLDIKPKLEALMWHVSKKSWKLGARHIHSTTSPEETIIFEDLGREGFELQSRQIGLDLEHSKLVLQKLAEYHALTMLMAQKEPDTIIARYPFGLVNKYTINAPSFKELSGAQLLKLAELIEKRAGYRGIAEKLRAYRQNFEEKLYNAIYPMEGAINVLNHGDVWVNNLFFKNDQAHKPIEVQFIDFQLCYYGSPGFDIIYFLTTSVKLDVLKTKRSTLVEFYYECLIETLKGLPYNQPLPSYEDLINEIQRREAYGLFVAIAFFPLMSMTNVDSQDVSLENLGNSDFVSRKIERMFTSNPRTMNTLLYLLQRANDLGILD